jgi:hypothetical protein
MDIWTGFFKRLFVLGLLFSMILLGSACQMQQKGRKPSPDWSRGLPLGVFVRGDTDLVVEPDGSLTHFVWLTEDEEGLSGVQYVKVDETAVTQISHLLEIPAEQISHPRLILSNDDTIHLLWSSRGNDARAWDLWYGQLDTLGTVQDGIMQLASVDDNVTGYDVVSDGLGGLFVAWENGFDDSIYGTQIGPDGTVVQPVQKIATGESPSIKMDKAGALHMAWLSGADISYATWPNGELETAVATVINSRPESLSQKLDGPEIGIAGEWVTILWATYFNSGLEAGTAATEYVSFPINNPQRTAPTKIKIATHEEPQYEAYQGAYHLTQLSPPGIVGGSTNYVREPNATEGRGDELAVALTVSQDFRLNAFIQVATALFKNGEFVGYQMSGKTEAFSQNPLLATDDNGDLYMAWREGGRGTLAYYALTTEAGQAALNRMGANDVATVAMNGGIEVIAGILFFPLACLWFVPGLLIIGLYHFWKGESELKKPITVILVIISLAVSQVMKFLFLPTMITYVPFSAWLDIPKSWQNPMILIVPITTAVIGLLVATLMRKRTPSGLAFFFWFVATDAILTLAIYGVNFMGVF